MMSFESLSAALHDMAHAGGNSDDAAEEIMKLVDARLQARPAPSVSSGDPIPMILHCPECGARHIDDGAFATKPHHTHSCQECGLTWRPAVVPTVGVQFLPGFKNASPAGPDAVTPASAIDNENAALSPNPEIGRIQHELTEARVTIANLAGADSAIRDARAIISGHLSPIDQLRADPEILDRLGLRAAVDDLASQYEEASAVLGSPGPYGLPSAARAVVEEREALMADARGPVLADVRAALGADGTVSAVEASRAMRARADAAEEGWRVAAEANRTLERTVYRDGFRDGRFASEATTQQAERAAKALGCTVAELGERAEKRAEDYRHAVRFAKVARAAEDYVRARRDASPGGAQSLIAAYETLVAVLEGAPATPRTEILGHVPADGKARAPMSTPKDSEKRVALGPTAHFEWKPLGTCDRCASAFGLCCATTPCLCACHAKVTP